MPTSTKTTGRKTAKKSTSTEGAKTTRARKKVAPGKGKTVKSDKTPKEAAAEKAEKKSGRGRKAQMPDTVKTTLEHLKATGGDTRKNARKETGNQNLGLPWLIKQGYVSEEKHEDTRAYTFKITGEGEKLLKTLE